jgi:hypothetical protein
MKTGKDQKANKKFDLKKFEVAKLKNMHLIIGGDGDIITGTQTVQKKTVKD